MIRVSRTAISALTRYPRTSPYPPRFIEVNDNTGPDLFRIRPGAFRELDIA
jgi:hypothetical protein